MRSARWWKCGLAFTLALFMMTACDDDSTGPGDPDAVDPVTTSQALDDLSDQFFTENEAVQSLNALAPFIVGAGLDIVPATVAPANPTELENFTARAWDAVRRVVDRRSEGELLASIPVDLLGKTLVFNPETGAYEVDPERTDAPESGVRFILYAVDPITEQPITPLQEIGWVDIVDTSSAPTVNVALTAVVNGETLIDYSVEATASETDFSITSSGFFSDGTEQLSFDLDLSGTGTTETLTIDGSLNLAATDVTVSVNLGTTFDATTEQGTASLTAAIEHQGNTVSFGVDVDAEGNISGDVRFNGAVVALISGNVETEEFSITNAEGGELTAEEIEALERIFDAFNDVFEAAGGVVLLTLVLVGFAF